MCDVGFSRSAIAVREVWTNGFARNAPLVSAWRQEDHYFHMSIISFSWFT